MSLPSVPSYNPFEPPLPPKISLEEVPSAKNWPTPIGPVMRFHGLAGDFVRLIRSSTEADDHALLVSFPDWCGRHDGPRRVFHGRGYPPCS